MSESRITLRPALVAWILIGLLGTGVGALFAIPSFESAQNRAETALTSENPAPMPRQPEGLDRRQLDGNEPVDPEAYLNRPASQSPPNTPHSPRSERP